MSGRVPERVARSAVWIIVGVSIISTVAGAAMALTRPQVENAAATEDPFTLFVIGSLVFTLAGALIAMRRSGNTVGWIFLTIGLLGTTNAVAYEYAIRALLAGEGSRALGDLGAWFSSSASLLMTSLFALLLLYFPTGDLPSRRWRLVSWLFIVSLLSGIASSIAVWSTRGETLLFGEIDQIEGIGIGGFLGGVAYATATLAIIGGLAAMVVRFVRSKGIERLQLKWFTYAAAIAVICLVIGPVTGALSSPWDNLVVPLSIPLIPISATIAILKYRLYDIDVVINKTLVFGALAAFITAVYVAVVVGIGALLGSSEEPNLVLSIAATALVAIAFQPVKERVQRVANRLVYGQRSTPYEVMANLSRVASGAIEPHDILPSVAAVAASGVGARAARVSLVLHSGDTLEATHPPELEDDLHYDVVVPLRHRDETIGELAVAKAAGEQLSPGDRKLLEDLAAQAALALHNARLAIELGARLDEISIQAHELDASRRRIVSAQDDSRRRLERDISSGPRLNLEDMRGELAAIKEVMDDDPQRAAGLLGELAGRANQTLDALRDLARGIFPPLLADKGIVAALEAHIRKHELDVELHADEGLRAARFDERVEIAVYFCCLEALASRSAQTVLALEVKDGELEMSCSGVVLDDARRETIRDRVEALAGTVRLGEGDGLRARFPVAMLEVAG